MIAVGFSRCCCCRFHSSAYEPPCSMSCGWGPSSMIRPSEITAILFALMTVESRCAMMTVVRPFVITSNASWIWCSVWVSRALVASSRITIFGFFRIVRAMATRCFSPPESRSPRSPTLVSYPSGKPLIVSWIAAAFAAASTSSMVASGRP
mmetsp:Transcript_47496/g.113087  ORF Transcript_47496/g.113087 Transcript_47496/m.113087 type:complete len:151 (-) Transcript_47496:1479-1931(-)